MSSHRGAGILLHITSLPSAFGIGDLGPEAEKFAGFLSRSQQRYWQLLPLNPVGPDQGYSPYSSVSSMAGNVLLISPEQLVRDNLISAADISPYKVKPSEEVDFTSAHKSREKILPLAYDNFLRKKKLVRRFSAFCKREAYWIRDFACYIVLKKLHNNRPWYEWSDEFKTRNTKAVSSFLIANAKAIRYIQWEQFVFFDQWQRLKKYCNTLGIQMFGDLPFYVSYDSADVWSHRDIFNVDSNGKMTGIAGVPPDYFNRNGQLWGMPTFKWDVLKRKKYSWWEHRIRWNIELFNMLRLDHFRAFADYWEVPAGQSTAIKGKWKVGPRHHFFHSLQKSIGALPFVAEDLGDINDAVYKLRDDFKMPGMKVLQFAFGDTMPTSVYIPHNYTSNFIVYTGTHDNNTTRGWYRNDLKEKDRHQIADYLAKPVTETIIGRELSRLGYASIANTVIIPLQDILELDEKARMNTPASVTGNWLWRFDSRSLTRQTEKDLRRWVKLYNR
jgi:4-alpha-glucanotransferase